MKDMAMHILDIVENSVRAESTKVDIELNYHDDILNISIRDNGCGMDVETAKKAVDPYTTSRTSRKVGLGLPFLKMNAEQTGGTVTVESEKGKGTLVVASFLTSHIDCVPQGDLAGTLALLITGHPDVSFRIRTTHGKGSFEITSGEIKEVLEGFPISHPKVNVFIKNMLKKEI